MSDYDLIVNGLQEVVGDDILQKIVASRPLKVYWGTAATGRIHIGYYTPLLKIAELVDAGCEVTILVADIHAILDNLKSNEKQVRNRSNYYVRVIKTMLKELNVDLDLVKFVLGSSFQTSPEYIMDIFRMNTVCTVKDTKHAGAEVVKLSRNPLMSGLLYPILQALDEEYLKADAQLGGIDQRKIFMFAREFLPKLGYKKRIHLMTPMVSGLRYKSRNEPEEESEELDKAIDIKFKMSASNNKTKLDMLDTRAEIRSKINKVYCPPKDIDDNSVLDILQTIIFPLLRRKEQNFVMWRKEEHGGPVTFADFQEVQGAYESGELHPNDLKAAVVHNLDIFIEPVRKEFISHEWKQVLKHAYE